MLVRCIGICRALLLFAATVAGAQQISKPSTDDKSPFLSIPPFVPDTLRFEAKIPDFEASDTNGRVWRSGDLLGKLTVIDIWSTQSLREGVRVGGEHPELQRFYERMKGSKNIRVLTFCTDYDYTHAPAYMTERNYTFPVIADWKLTDKLFGGAGNLPQLLQWPGWQKNLRSFHQLEHIHFPQQWVINREGRLSAWFRYWTLDDILPEVERAATGPEAPR
jgi:peroxiredoxin